MPPAPSVEQTPATPAYGLYSAEFFDLQLRFAARVAELSGRSLADAVGHYTNIYVRLGIGHRLDVANPDWQRYVEALAKVREPAKWTHLVHRRRMRLPAGPALASSVGCFSFALVGDGLVRLHFHPGEHPVESPLAAANQHLRQRELATLLAGLKTSFGEDVRIVGASWLYNLAAYRRLFPQRYLASLEPVEHPYQRMPLWGQFLNRDRGVRPDAATRFLSAIARASSLSELGSCFPYCVLATAAPAKWLYDHAGL